ncbi:MAG: hypothetical protein QNJ54_24605 [Prochloraceae cyanobacterium]|nr:hypothetical protein [Prochloraceae cyanobacterium]
MIEEVIYKYNYEGIGILGFTTYLSFVYLIKEIFGDDFFSRLLIKIANNSLTLALFLYLTIIGFGILLLPAYPNLKNQSISSLIYQIINWLFPNNLFLHGEEKIEYENLIQRRKNFFWGVIVGLLVSIIGGIVVLSIS